MSVTEWDVAVVGAGIAGLSAAEIVVGHGMSCVAFDQLSPGGQLINLAQVSHYPGLPKGTSGVDLVGGLLESAMESGVEITYAEVTGLSLGGLLTVDTAEGKHRARAVVVATGLTAGRTDVRGADRFVGRGLSECASCDGPLFADREVVVVGNDEWTAQEAIELAAVAAAVTVVVGDREPIWSIVRGRLLHKLGNVEVRTEVEVSQLTGDESGALSEVVLTTPDGALSPMSASGVFVYQGKSPRTSFLGEEVRRAPDGRLIGPDDLATAATGVFAAGDVRAGSVPYLVSASADGIRAGLAAVEFVRSRQPGSYSVRCAVAPP